MQKQHLFISRLGTGILFYLLLSFNHSKAQTFTTPEVASFKQEAFRPVAYYTGQATISLPITQIQTNEITVPITLNYVGGEGLRPINPYSSAGMGWRVSAGGAISRTKNGICDEFTIASNGGVINGFFNLTPNSVTNSYVRNNVSSYVTTGLAGQYFVPTTEYSPDVFSFSFLGYSGYFLMGYDGQFKIQSQDIVSVEKISNVSWPGQGNTIAFKLTANDGTTFTFGGQTGSMELSGGNAPGVPYEVNAWYITEIKSVNGRTVKFNYQPNDQTFVRFSTSSDNSPLLFGDAITDSTAVDKKDPNTSNDATLAVGTLSNSPVVLSNIVFNGGKVVVTSSMVTQYLIGSSSNPRMIDKIELLDSDNTVVSTSSFTYSSENDLRYYFLDKFLVDGKSYVFNYYDRAGLPSLGTYLGTDYWGFYNGGLEVTSVGGGNVSSFWDQFLNPTVTYDKRLPVFERTKRGVLTSITYPTGGVESFDYELNTYSYLGSIKGYGTSYDFSEEPKVAGGLRIAKITLGDMVRKYKYVNSFDPNNPDYLPATMSYIGFSSSGILYRLPGIPYFGRTTVNALSIDGEPPVVYGKVIEFLSDKSYTEYTLRSPLDQPDQENILNPNYYSAWFSDNSITNYYSPKGFVGNLGKNSSASLERGQVSMVKVYDGANVLKKSIAYTYSSDPNRFNQNVAVVNTSVTTADQGLAQLALEFTVHYGLQHLAFSVIHSYEIYTFPVYLEQEVETSYESGNTIQKTTQYQYNSQKLRSEIRFTNSKGKTIKTKINYPSDINTGTYASMVSKKMLSVPIEQVQLVDNKIISSQLTTYQSLVNGTNTFYVPSKKFTLETTAPVGESDFSYFNGSTRDSRYSTTPDISYDSYSSFGNNRQSTTRDGLQTSYLYDTLGIYPMARVKGAAYSSISAQNGKSASYSSSTLFSGIQVLAPTAEITTYSYKPLVGVSAMTDPAGKSTLYEYDGFGRLITVKTGAGLSRNSYCYNYAGQLTPCSALAPMGSIAASPLALIGLNSPPLPVTLVDFEAAKRENTVELTWSTSSEINTEGFEIQRSADARQWISLGFVAAKGNLVEGSPARDNPVRDNPARDNSLQKYVFTDTKPRQGENLYRLKLIDRSADGTDGASAYSKIRSVTFGKNEEIALFPNPVTIGESLRLSGANVDKIETIRFFDSSGKLALESAPAKEINTSGLARGLYIVQITFVDGSTSTHKLVKQ